MKLTKFIIILLIVIIGLNCSRNNGEYNKLPLNKIEKITSIKEFAPARFYKQPKIYILGDYLIVYSPLLRDKKVDIYDKNSFKHLVSTGISGAGPGEITAPGPILVDIDKGCFWVCDFGKLLMYKFSLDSIINIPDYKPSFSYKLPTGVGFLGFYFKDSDTIIASSLQLAEKQIKLKNICLSNQTLSPTNYDVPSLIKSDNYYSGMYDFYSMPFTKTLVCGYYFSDLLLFLDEQGNILKSIEGPMGINKLDKPDAHNSCKLAYSQVTGNDKYIFALFNGNPRNAQNIEGSSGKYIRIFNSKGDYIKTLELEDNLAEICYDADKKRIIAISNDRENSLIYFDVNL